MYQALFPDIYIDTIYFGGGTPSILPPDLIIRALNTVKANFTLNSDIEITLEANPGTVDEQKLQYLYQNGINRLSFGVQAVQDDLLQKIGRIHTIKEAEMAIEMAQKIGFKNISMDLMYGLPGQTLEMLKEAVSWAVNKNMQHISIYGLQIEENTVFGRLYDQGKLILPSEDESDGEEQSFLTRSYELHFNERPYLNHRCYLFLTKTTRERSRQRSDFSTLCRGFLLPREITDKDTACR